MLTSWPSATYAIYSIQKGSTYSPTSITFNFSSSWSAVRGLNITRCLGPYNDSYTCPGLSDPPERTHCCMWNSKPACCPQGGSSCSDSADIRNYCPGPNEGDDRTHCCVWDSKPTCCHPGGSTCNGNADIRSYCPGSDVRNDQTHCCIWDSKPTCCFPGGSSCGGNIRNYCPGPSDGKNDRFCAQSSNSGKTYCR